MRKFKRFMIMKRIKEVYSEICFTLSILIVLAVPAFFIISGLFIYWELLMYIFKIKL